MDFSVGMSADEVVYHSRNFGIEPVSPPKQIGMRDDGMTVQWFYPNGVTFTFERTIVNGAVAYRITKIEMMDSDVKE